MIIKTENGYKVKVWDHGYVIMCEYKDGKWQDCIFATEEEAQEALNRYNEFWGR